MLPDVEEIDFVIHDNEVLGVRYEIAFRLLCRRGIRLDPRLSNFRIESLDGSWPVFRVSVEKVESGSASLTNAVVHTFKRRDEVFNLLATHPDIVPGTLVILKRGTRDA